jgi:hypothetical protein
VPTAPRNLIGANRRFDDPLAGNYTREFRFWLPVSRMIISASCKNRNESPGGPNVSFNGAARPMSEAQSTFVAVLRRRFNAAL